MGRIFKMKVINHQREYSVFARKICFTNVFGVCKIEQIVVVRIFTFYAIILGNFTEKLNHEYNKGGESFFDIIC